MKLITLCTIMCFLTQPTHADINVVTVTQLTPNCINNYVEYTPSRTEPIPYKCYYSSIFFSVKTCTTTVSCSGDQDFYYDCVQNISQPQIVQTSITSFIKEKCASGIEQESLYNDYLRMKENNE